MINIILIGLPGSGKSTIAKALAKNFSTEVVSLGREVDLELQKDTPLSKEIAAVHNELLWHPLPDEIGFKLIERKILSMTSYVIEGYPRSVKQYGLSKKLFGECTIFIYIDVNVETARQRFLKREGLERSSVFDQRLDVENSRIPSLLAEISQTRNFYTLDGENSIVEIISSITKIIK